MKKIVLLFFVIYFVKLPISYGNDFWSNKVDGPRSKEAAIEMHEGKKFKMTLVTLFLSVVLTQKQTIPHA